MHRTLAFALLALSLAQPVFAADAAAGKKPGESFQDCADCQTMVVVPAGSFTMGSSAAEREREGVPETFGSHEGPQVKVTIARPFAFATTETTKAQWARFVAATNRPIPTECFDYNVEQDSWGGTPGKVVNWQNTGFAQTDNHPVACISWQDATEYAAWMTQATGQKYRLATEAEWEYAARGGTTTARPWGDSVTAICNKARIMTSGTFEAIHKGESWVGELVCAEDESYTKPVKSYDANPWGIYDTLGNLWEWVADCAAPDHSKLPSDGTAQTAANGGDCNHRLSKGGAFHSRVWLARPATRGDGQGPANRPLAAGIRIVRELN